MRSDLSLSWMNSGCSVTENSSMRILFLENRICHLSVKNCFSSKTWRNDWAKSSFPGKSFSTRRLFLENRIYHSRE